MKRIALLLSLAYFLMPSHISAQYSDASVNGPWITFSQTGGNGGGGVTYVIFNGSGTINAIGTSDDSLHPCGTYSITGPGAITAVVNMIGGPQNLSGQMINDSSFNLLDTASHGPGPIYAYEVLNTGALAGTWSGFLLDSMGMSTRNITLTINGSGAISSATGLAGASGNIFAGRDTFAGYFTTVNDSCPLAAVQIGGVIHGDSLLGMAQFGTHNSNCQSNGVVVLVNHSLGIRNVNSGIDFSVYPNPFTDRIDIAINHPGQKMQADLYDLYGRKVLSQSLGSDQNTSLNAGSLGSGLYLLTLTDQDGNSTTKRVLKN